MLNKVSDEKIDEIISLCERLNLSKALRNVEEIDFQGKTFLRLLPNPLVLPALIYFFFLHLSANP
jgi:hypothetical protein